MKKLILISLVIFFTICSKSWADVEIWGCDIIKNGSFDDQIYKIDTSIPMVYQRIQGKWKPIYPPKYYIEYRDDSIFYSNPDKEVFKIYDLFLKKELWLNPKTGITFNTYSCKVIK